MNVRIPFLIFVLGCFAFNGFNQSITNIYLKGGDNDGYGMQSLSFLLPAPLGVDEYFETPETLFPNPVSQVLYIDLLMERNYTQLELYDMLGKMVFSTAVLSGKKRMVVNVNMLATGIYYFKLYYDKKNFSVLQFVKD